MVKNEEFVGSGCLILCFYRCSLVGASANLIVVGFAERSGHTIRFVPFLLMAFPLMLLSIAISSIYIWLRYL